MENLARYIIRASFSQERMHYLEQEGSVIYKAKDGKNKKDLSIVGMAGPMCSHIPSRGKQLVRHDGDRWLKECMQSNMRRRPISPRNKILMIFISRLRNSFYRLLALMRYEFINVERHAFIGRRCHADGLFGAGAGAAAASHANISVDNRPLLIAVFP